MRPAWRPLEEALRTTSQPVAPPSDKEVEKVDDAAPHEHEFLDYPGGDAYMEVSDLAPGDLEGPTTI